MHRTERSPNIRILGEGLLLFGLLVILLGSNGWAQVSPIPETSPKELVEQLWTMAARGELLTKSGLAIAAKFFTSPGSPRGRKVIRVFSDFYGVNYSSVDGKNAIVEMEYVDCGGINEKLQYTSPRLIQAYKTSFKYHLVLVPGYSVIYGGDGKTIVQKKEIPGVYSWQIEGPLPDPWITVNAAIRYVIEARDKSNDTDVKANAEMTLKNLLKMH
jgi:hypothetical protein